MKSPSAVPTSVLSLPKHIEWVGDARAGFLRLLDQTRLPVEEVWIEARDVQAVWQAIKRLSVRGAPAIGIAAAFGCVIGAQRGGRGGRGEFAKAAEYLATSRPTAVNLFWAIERMKRRACEWESESAGSNSLVDNLLEEALAIHNEDRAACRSIGRHGLALLRELTNDDLRLLTHCNAGALATGGIGTATAPMYTAQESKLPLAVYADETRPLLQGARLTAWELSRAGIDVTLITDSTAGVVMREGKVKAVITGADRIAANGDAANKIGTYSVALLAQMHHVPFVVAAPTSTFDMTLANGDDIPIEERGAAEITEGFGKRTAPQGVSVYAPAFDVTPASFITAIVTEHGVIRPVDVHEVARHFDANQ